MTPKIIINEQDAKIGGILCSLKIPIKKGIIILVIYDNPKAKPILVERIADG
jgi:hypothetical protein